MPSADSLTPGQEANHGKGNRGRHNRYELVRANARPAINGARIWRPLELLDMLACTMARSGVFVTVVWSRGGTDSLHLLSKRFGGL